MKEGKYKCTNEVYKKAVKAELRTLELEHCFDNFIRNGYDYVDHFPFLTDGTLTKIGLKQGDIKKFRRLYKKIEDVKAKNVKITMLGYVRVGKSCLAIRYCQDTFINDYDPTIEATWQVQKKIQNMHFTLDILDTCGGEDNQHDMEHWMDHADCIMFVFDRNDPISFKQCKKFFEKAKEVRKDDLNFPCVLVGNKCDLDCQVKTADAMELARIMKCPYVEASAKNDINCEEAFEKLILSWRSTMPVVERKVGGFCTIL